MFKKKSEPTNPDMGNLSEEDKRHLEIMTEEVERIRNRRKRKLSNALELATAVLKAAGLVVGIFFGVALLYCFVPVIGFLGGLGGGYLVKWLVGGWVVEGLNHIFAARTFTESMIPPMLGVIGMVASFLTAGRNQKSSKSDD